MCFARKFKNYDEFLIYLKENYEDEEAALIIEPPIEFLDDKSLDIFKLNWGKTKQYVSGEIKYTRYPKS